MSERATWSTADINNLPDSAFLYVEPGGKKDAEGKTTPRSLRHFPYKDASGAVDLPHLRNALARIPQSSLSPALKSQLTAKAQKLLKGQNGRSEEFRAQPAGYELRDTGTGMPTLVGYLAVFNEWAEINSRMEGHFLERIAPGAFTKTVSENRDRMRVLFQHGQDPQIGDKPLGPIQLLEPDGKGLRYEVPLLDTSYNRDLVAMLAADPPVLGSSFRFQMVRDEKRHRPEKSAHNPRGLPERTVQEARLKEFGPVTFPAYTGAKAGLRSITDRMMRMDSEDLSTLAQMMQLGGCYIDEQDEPGDQANIPKMEAVLATLVELSNYEATEPEETEDEADEESSADGRADRRGGTAGERDNAPPGDRAALGAHPVRGRRGRVPLRGMEQPEVRNRL